MSICCLAFDRFMISVYTKMHELLATCHKISNFVLFITIFLIKKVMPIIRYWVFSLLGVRTIAFNCVQVYMNFGSCLIGCHIFKCN